MAGVVGRAQLTPSEEEVVGANACCPPQLPCVRGAVEASGISGEEIVGPQAFT
jgi:hypothetical protein